MTHYAGIFVGDSFVHKNGHTYVVERMETFTMRESSGEWLEHQYFVFYHESGLPHTTYCDRLHSFRQRMTKI